MAALILVRKKDDLMAGDHFYAKSETIRAEILENNILIGQILVYSFAEISEAMPPVESLDPI